MRTSRGILSLLVLATSGLGPATASTVGTATAATSCVDRSAPSHVTDPNDLNDDGYSDVVVGVPNASPGGLAGAGAVDIRYPHVTGGLAVERITEASIGFTSYPGAAAHDGFGTAIAAAQLQPDEPSPGKDLLIGTPGFWGSRGAVWTVRGTATGVQPVCSDYIGRNDGDRFGTSVAVAGRHVFIGAPGQTVGGKKGAGAVYEYDVLPTFGSTFVKAISENTPGIPGTAEAGDHFGQVLSAFGDAVAVGEPGEDAGREQDAGAVTLLTTDPRTGVVASARKVSEDTAGVPGTARAGDRFGAGVSLAQDLVVGVPGKERRSARRAGMVQVFAGATAARPLSFLSTVSQETATVPGTSRTGDQFGASVLLIAGDELSIGAPGKSLGGAAATGEVVPTAVDVDTGAVRSIGPVIRMGGAGRDNIPGVPRAQAHTGASLSLMYPSQDVDPDAGAAGVVVSVPGWSSGARTAAGEVWVSGAVGSYQIDAGGVYRDSAGPVAGERYGTPLGPVSDAR